MSQVDYELSGGLAIISLSTDRTGALNPDTYAELEHAVLRSSRDGARAVLLRTRGKVFASGFDISVFKGMSTEQAQALFTDLLRAVQALEGLTVPVIAAVHGQCMGGGLELALACDLIVAREDTMFGQIEVRVGGTTFMGGVYRLAERCGSARALEIAMTGDLYTADKFEQWNIVQSVQSADDFADYALAIANKIANGPTAAHVVTKQLSRSAGAKRLQELDALLLKIAPDLLETQDMQSAVDMIMSIGPRKFMSDPSVVVFDGK